MMVALAYVEWIPPKEGRVRVRSSGGSIVGLEDQLEESKPAEPPFVILVGEPFMAL